MLKQLICLLILSVALSLDLQCNNLLDLGTGQVSLNIVHGTGPFTVNLSNAPPGLAFQNGNLVAVGVVQAGQYVIQIDVRDAKGAKATKIVILNVNQNVQYSPSSANGANGNTGSFFSTLGSNSVLTANNNPAGSAQSSPDSNSNSGSNGSPQSSTPVSSNPDQASSLSVVQTLSASTINVETPSNQNNPTTSETNNGINSLPTTGSTPLSPITNPSQPSDNNGNLLSAPVIDNSFNTPVPTFNIQATATQTPIVPTGISNVNDILNYYNSPPATATPAASTTYTNNLYPNPINSTPTVVVNPVLNTSVTAAQEQQINQNNANSKAIFDAQTQAANYVAGNYTVWQQVTANKNMMASLIANITAQLQNDTATQQNISNQIKSA